MAINRQNYEEYFLLYADEELSIHQRMEVEWFVQQNQDLAPELELFKHARLIPDEKITFFHKEALLKIPDSHINLNNYEEQFLLYIDNELDEGKRTDVEKFVLQHPQLQGEFNLLQQAVFPLETVEFADKSVLYRQKEDSKKLVPFRWWRIAVAAALLIAVSTIWYKLPKNNTEVAQAPKQEIKNPEQELQPEVKQQPAQQNDQQSLATVENKIETKEAPVKPTNTATVNKNAVVKTKTTQQPVINQPFKKEETAIAENTKPVEKKEPFVAQVKPEHKPVQPVVSSDALQQQNGMEINDNASFAANTQPEKVNIQTAVFKELDTDADDDRRTAYVGSMQLNKSKVKNFLKKASRIFGSKNEEETNDGKLQVANFEIEKQNK